MTRRSETMGSRRPGASPRQVCALPALVASLLLVLAPWFTRRSSTGSRSPRRPHGQGQPALPPQRSTAGARESIHIMTRIHFRHSATGRPETGAWEGDESVLPARIPANKASAATPRQIRGGRTH